jgi:hypothetical protein
VADYTPVYTSGILPFTKTASAAITGGQVVETTTTGAVGPAAAGSLKCVGVAANDTASGARVTVWPLANVEHEIVVVAAATVTVGDAVIAGTAGTVNTAAVAVASAAGTLIGMASTTATAPNKVRFVGRG